MTSDQRSVALRQQLEQDLHEHAEALARQFQAVINGFAPPEAYPDGHPWEALSVPRRQLLVQVFLGLLVDGTIEISPP